MAQKTKNDVAVATFADHEVITPPNRLRTAVSTVADDADDDPVARAEAALAGLSSEFATWMDEECARLDAARHATRAEGFTAAHCDALFHAAHDIKGEAATFGFPAVAAAAESLCRLLEHVPDVKRIPQTLVDQHVDAVRAIFREYARNDADALSSALTAKLKAVTDDFLVQENRDRPDYLDGIVSPPIVPEDPAG